MLYLKTDVLQFADVFENFVEKSTLMYSINPLFSYSAPGYTWKAGLKVTNKKLGFIKDTAKLTSGKEFLLLLENNIRGVTFNSLNRIFFRSYFTNSFRNR